MPHRNIYEMFKALFPMYAEGSITWFPNGHDSIRIRISPSIEFIFTFHTKKSWSFETVDSWMAYRIKPKKV